MRWFLHLIASALLCSSLYAADPLADSQPLDVYLLIGQSNMAGRGKIEPQDQVADPHIWKLDKSEKWVPAIDPLHFDKPKVAGVGLGLTFARTMLKHDPDRYIGLVPAAFGGTSIDQWAKGGELYAQAVKRCKIAQKHGKLAAILWHQGESDTSDAKADAYLEKLTKLIADLRADLDSPDAPLVVGQLGPFYGTTRPAKAKLDRVLQDAPRTIRRCAFVSSEGLTDIGDHTHFDAASQRELGRRYAAALLSLRAATTQPSTTQPSDADDSARPDKRQESPAR